MRKVRETTALLISQDKQWRRKSRRWLLVRGLTLDGQGVQRISTMKDGNHPKVETCTIIRIGTWNVRIMFMAGKTHNIIREMEKLEIGIMGISEVRWPKSRKCIVNKSTIYYSRNDLTDHPNGVGFIVSPTVQHAVINFIPYTDRLTLLRSEKHKYNPVICSNSW